MAEIPTPDAAVPILTDVTPERLIAEIVPAGRPVVLKGMVSDWPVVQAARRSPAEAASHLRAFDSRRPVRLIVGAPAIGGRFFYDETLSGLNFTSEPSTVSALLDRLADGAFGDHAAAVQGVRADEILPGFSRANPSPLADPAVPPRLWIGNAATVQTHHDLNDNIACAVAGRRRFILFPPEQTRNLYIGPFERTPAGALVSIVRLDAPDLERHPRFAEAWAAAQVADLAPGDALFIPYMWWHHVQSLDAFSILANYWWNAAADRQPMPALIHAMLAVRDLPPDQRRAWAAMFEAFVFDPESPPGRHLPAARRGVQGVLSDADAAQIRAMIARTLSAS